jgi:hypothetical protein
LNAISKGCGFLYLSGHGNTKVWTTTDSFGNSTMLSTMHTYFLTNRAMEPVCILGGCQNCRFDFRGFNLVFKLRIPICLTDCLGWSLINKDNGGAIALIGCTDLSWQDVEFQNKEGGTNWLEIEFFREFQNGTKRIGDIWKSVISQYIKTFPIDWNEYSLSDSSLHAKTVQQWILFGDPTLNIGGYELNR